MFVYQRVSQTKSQLEWLRNTDFSLDNKWTQPISVGARACAGESTRCSGSLADLHLLFLLEMCPGLKWLLKTNGKPLENGGLMGFYGILMGFDGIYPLAMTNSLLLKTDPWNQGSPEETCCWILQYKPLSGNGLVRLGHSASLQKLQPHQYHGQNISLKHRGAQVRLGTEKPFWIFLNNLRWSQSIIDRYIIYSISQ